MKQFNLEEYLKNPTRKIVTKDGRNVRIICTDRKDFDAPIVALVDYGTTEGESCLYYTKEGKIYTDDSLVSDADLFFDTQKHEGWVNIFKGTIDDYYVGDSRVFESKEDAEKAGKEWSGYTSVKIEWEEYICQR